MSHDWLGVDITVSPTTVVKSAGTAARKFDSIRRAGLNRVIARCVSGG